MRTLQGGDGADVAAPPPGGDEPDDAPPAPEEAPVPVRASPWRSRRLLVGLGVVAGVAVVCWLSYLGSTHFISGDSDGATVVLEGQSFAAGHVTLHGWALSLDSFWTVDVPFYALGVALFGLSPVLVNLVPAVIATAVVVVGALLAGLGRRRAGVVAGAVVVVALLGLPTPGLAHFFLRGPLHVGTVLWCLLAFAGLRTGRLRWGAAGAAVLFAAGLLGDLQMLALGVVPAAAAGLVAMARCRSLRAGAPAVLAAAGGVALAAGVRVVTRILGAFSVGHTNPTATDIGRNVADLWHFGSSLGGVGNHLSGPGALRALADVVHGVGLALILAAAVVALVRLVLGAATGSSAAAAEVAAAEVEGGDGPGAPASDVGRSAGAEMAGEPPVESWRLDDLLLLAMLGSITVFLVLATTPMFGFARYLTAGFIFGAVLCGRVVAAATDRLPSLRGRRVAAALGAVVVAGYLVATGLALRGPMPARSPADLGSFLASKGLTDGLGAYWSASIVTVDTHGSVRVRPVVADRDGHLVRYGKNSAVAWYRGQRFQFLVYDTKAPWGRVNAGTAEATFGPFAASYLVDGYRVLVWNHPIAIGDQPNR